MDVLLFSLSISIDALGYSIGFGSKNIKIGLFQFFVLNLINTLILTLFISVFSKFEYLFKNNILSLIAPILMAIFGAYYIISAFCSKIKEIKDINNKQQKSLNFTNFLDEKLNKLLSQQDTSNYLSIMDLLLLFLVFVFENAFSTFVFYSSFSNTVLFISTNFIFHFFFFLLGFNLGKKLATKLNGHTSFVSGFIFLCLAYLEIFF